MAVRAVDRKVVRAAPSSRLLAGAITVLVVVGALIGCGHDRPASRRHAPEPRRGYAYTAVLMSRHPLYHALADLEAAIDELGDDEWDPVLEPIDERFEQIAFLESFALADPAERLAALRGGWRDGYPDLDLEPGALSPDLQARIDWERRRAARVVAERMAAGEAAETRRLAQLRAELVREHQERLTNLRIEGGLGGTERAERAEREQLRVWETIEAQLEAERQAGRELLAELEARLGREAGLRIEAAQRRADDATAARSNEMLAAGSGLYGEMIAEMSAPWAGPPGEEATALGRADEPNARLAEAEGSRQRAEAVRREAAREQRLRLVRAVGRLRARLKSGTETAARVVAHRDGIDLQLLPGGSARGENMTDTIGDKLRALWSGAEGQRS